MKALVAALMLLATPAVAQPASGEDPFLWLEEVEGEKALEWVRAQNARYLPELEANPDFATWRARAETILEDPRRIAFPSGAEPTAVTQTQVFNLWRDPANVRGIWRVSPRAAYDAGTPAWQTLIDLDALDAAEKRNWQWGGAQCLPPAYGRCLVRLSVGGKDAVTVREFDMATRRFVPASEGGFALPEAKQQLAFVRDDRLLVATAAGPVTTSGYAREARLWQRGTPFAAAKLLLEVPETDMGLWPAAYGDAEGRRVVVNQRKSFWTGVVHHLMADWTLVRGPLPEDADFRFIANLGDGPRAFALLRSDFEGIPKGSLVSYAVPNVGAPGPVERVFTPGPTQALDDVDATGAALYLNLLDNVSGRLTRLSLQEGRWVQSDIPVPANSALALIAADQADTLYFSATGFTQPTRLLMTSGGAAPTTLATAPTFLDGSKFEVSQRFATSRDGTRVPYFIVRPRNATGPLKTLFFAYGGFEIPMLPAYAQPDVQFWLEEGNQYVVGNIRGGGEFGPGWHQAALLEKRQNSYDDLHAIAAALKREKLASRIAIHGRSNGGLMASVAFTQRPDLYDAALVGVPLADMKRYHRLLAGASWMAEYGNPDTADWGFIEPYSPYQNLKAGVPYPRVFFYTSTKDDRVHPGHARKMAARMQQLGYPLYYYENVDGGHAGVANLKETAFRYALMLSYLDAELK